LLTTGGHHRQQPLREARAAFTLASKAALPPQHRRTQRPLRYVVGRLHPFHPREGPQRGPLLPQLTA